MKKINTDYTRNATCPWCGYENVDSWELEDGEYDCGSCEKPFVVERQIEVTYSTFKPKEQ